MHLRNPKKGLPQKCSPWSLLSPSYPVDTQWPSIAGGICTVILAPLWRCLSMWWHCDSLNALQALFSKDLGYDLLSGWRRAEPSPSPEKEQWKSAEMWVTALQVGNAHTPPPHQALSLPPLSETRSKVGSVLGDHFPGERTEVHGDKEHGLVWGHLASSWQRLSSNSYIYETAKDHAAKWGV